MRTLRLGVRGQRLTHRPKLTHCLTRDLSRALQRWFRRVIWRHRRDVAGLQMPTHLPLSAFLKACASFVSHGRCFLTPVLHEAWGSSKLGKGTGWALWSSEGQRSELIQDLVCTWKRSDSQRLKEEFENYRAVGKHLVGCTGGRIKSMPWKGNTECCKSPHFPRVNLFRIFGSITAKGALRAWELSEVILKITPDS